MNQLRLIPLVLSRVLSPGSTRDASIRSSEAFDILRQRRRQRIIEYLIEVEEQVTLRDLSGYIADLEGCDRKRVYIALYQNHLPKLDEVGALRYQRRSGVITATRTTQLLWIVLRGTRIILVK